MPRIASCRPLRCHYRSSCEQVVRSTCVGAALMTQEQHRQNLKMIGSTTDGSINLPDVLRGMPLRKQSGPCCRAQKIPNPKPTVPRYISIITLITIPKPSERISHPDVRPRSTFNCLPTNPTPRPNPQPHNPLPPSHYRSLYSRPNPSSSDYFHSASSSHSHSRSCPPPSLHTRTHTQRTHFSVPALWTRVGDVL